MAEINFNSIYDGVSLALHAAFPARQVHGGQVKQGLNPGDFNVVLPGSAHNKQMGTRYKRTTTVDVIYYPVGGMAECHAMAHEVALILESITTPEGDVVHAVACDYSVTDDVLHVLLQYVHHSYIPQELENMETLRIEQEG